MTPSDALTLARDDIVLYQSQTWRVITPFANGYMLRLHGKHTNTEVPSARCLLVYRQGEVPPGFAVGLLNAEEEATVRQVIQRRKEGH